jgi:hypothetical protein
MSTMREHLAKAHLRMAEHMAETAKRHAQLAACHKTLSENGQKAAEGGEIPNEAKLGAGYGAEQFARIGEHHAALSAECADCATYHTSACKELNEAVRAANDELGKSDQIRPDGVRATIPTDAPRVGGAVYAVPRVGQRELINSAGIPEDMATTFLKIQE